MTRTKPRKGRASSKQPPAQEQPQSLFQRLQEYQVWLAISVLAVVVTFLSGFATLAGIPFWAAGPEVHPTNLDFAPPLSVPFDLHNRSVVFPTKILRVVCLMKDIKLPMANKMSNNTLADNYSATVQRDDTVPFMCGITVPFTLIESVKMQVCVFYITPIVGVLPSIYISRVWTWANHHWFEGGLLTRRKTEQPVPPAVCQLSGGDLGQVKVD